MEEHSLRDSLIEARILSLMCSFELTLGIGTEGTCWLKKSAQRLPSFVDVVVQEVLRDHFIVVLIDGAALSLEVGSKEFFSSPRNGHKPPVDGCRKAGSEFGKKGRETSGAISLIWQKLFL